MPFEASPLTTVRENIIRIKHPNVEYFPRTYLGAAAAAAAVTLTVRDNAGFLTAFTDSNFALIGNYGDERTEVRQITANPTAGTSIAVAAVTFAHPVDTQITLFMWNQVEVYGNTSNSTVGGTLLATISVTPDEEFTQYVVTGTTFAFYYARYRNSVIPRTSAFSDVSADTGLGAGTRGIIKQRALQRAGVYVGFPLADGEAITDEFLNAEVTNCELDIQQRSKQWAFLLTDNFGAALQLTQGRRNYALPATILDNQSNRSIVSVRISWGVPLTYIYPTEFNERTRSVIATTLAAALSVGDATVTLTTSGDMPTSGAILIGATTLNYTANNRTTNVLTLTAVSTIAAANGTEVYNGASTGLPIYYTVKSGNIIFHPIPDSSYNQRYAQIEFFRTITAMTTDGVASVVPFYNIFDIWLLWRIAERRNLPDEALRWKNEYEQKMAQAMQIHVKATDQKFYPGLAERQSTDYTRGRMISTVIN